MTAVPSGSGTAPGWAMPADDEGDADDAGDEEVDVLALAGRPVPAGGAWLWVTAADPQRGGELAGLFLPRHRPAACGGDVLVHLRPAGEPDGTPAARVQVWAVAAGSLVRVAAWDPAGLAAWPETVRETVSFAMGALTALQEHGADISARKQVEVIPAAEAAPAGFPALPTRVNAAG